MAMSYREAWRESTLRVACFPFAVSRFTTETR